ncbi:MAG: SGNH/GDSL hydrolase family protein [Clostridiaceae bacterium]|nr:SGNH/GDSL hydrolase family protein [Clostridiaceae bacterium]
MKTFVFFGDSVTEGCFGLYPTSYGFDTYRDPAAVYHAQLAPMLRAKYGDIAVINAGVSGDNAHHALERLDRDVLAYHPDTVVVCFGLNDVFHPLDRYEAALAEIFSRLSGVRQVIFATPNMLNTYLHPETLPSAVKIAQKTLEFQTDGTFDRYMDTARRTAAQAHVPICDMYAYWKSLNAAGEDITILLSNYINHPTPAMHRIFAEKLLPML